jgi:hypothetical protein
MNLTNITNSDWQTELLTKSTVINAFDCEDNELNDFLLNDAKEYLTSLLTVTYLIKLQNAFRYLTDKDKSGETRAMYFDLKAVN